MARIKGTAMIVAVKNLRLFKERARRLLPARLQKYLKERILVSSWYPEEDHLELIRVLARILPETIPESIGDEDVYVYMGRFSCRYALSGVYMQLISPGDPEGTLRRGATTWRVYRDTGSLHTAILGPGRARLELRDYELPSPEACRLNLGWYGELVRMSGGKDVRITEIRCCNRGNDSCVWEIEWKK